MRFDETLLTSVNSSHKPVAPEKPSILAGHLFIATIAVATSSGPSSAMNLSNFVTSSTLAMLPRRPVREWLFPVAVGCAGDSERWNRLRGRAAVIQPCASLAVPGIYQAAETMFRLRLRL